MGIGERMQEVLKSSVIFQFNLFGVNIPVTDTVIVMWIIMALIIVLAVVLTQSMKMVPEGKQNLAELFVSFINNLSKDTIGHPWRLFAPYIGTIAAFLIFANIFSIFNILPDWKWLARITGLHFLANIPVIEVRPPTQNINVTAALALASMFMVITGGIRVKGPRKWLKSFLEPLPLMLPFKVLDYFTRPTSLCLRLFGNIMGAFIVMELIYFVLPPVFPAAASIYFDLFDGLIQAYVFVFLTSFYIAESVE